MGKIDDKLSPMIDKICFIGIKPLFLRLHKEIMGVSKKNIGYDVYPIYITYYDIKSDNVFAVLYPKKDRIELGLAINKGSSYKSLKSAAHMKYPGMTRCIEIIRAKDFSKNTSNLLIEAYKNIASNSE